MRSNPLLREAALTGRRKSQPDALGELSIVIPSYNGRHHLTRCLKTLSIAAPTAEIVVVDGGSTDGSAELVSRDFPRVRLHRGPNHGWAHATNRGVALSTRRFLLFLNSDAFLSTDAASMMLERLERSPRVAAVAPQLRNEDGSRQAVFGFWYWPTWVELARPVSVPVLSAACLMTTRKHFEEIGAFDESFFLYNEELDWCRRARETGYSLELLPCNVVHIGGGSTAESPLLNLERQRGFVYLSNKHWPKWITAGLRGSMLLQGSVFKRLDPRPEYREMWNQLESLMRRGAYTESPFSLSGRGIPAFPEGIG